IAVDDAGHRADAFGEVDVGDGVRELVHEPRLDPRVGGRESEHGSLAGRLDPPEVRGPALRTPLARGEDPRLALPADLDEEPALPGPLPERLRPGLRL